MKKTLKNILIMCVAVACAFCMHLTVSAEPGGLFGGGISFEDISQVIQDYISKLTEPDEGETTTDPTTDANTTTGSDVTNDPVNNSGTGSLTTETTEPTNNYVPDNNGGNTYPTQPMPVTTEPAGDEPTSFDYDGSLSDWLEADSAAIIVHQPSETYTIAGLIVDNNNNGNGDSQSGFSWMQLAIIAAAIMLVILFALVVSLIVQKKRNSADDSSINADAYADDEAPKGPVPVEVMTADRIAELLGSAKKAQNGGYSSENSIRNAILMDQLTQSYSDPLIRKYTDEPVRMSPIANINVNDDISAADILKATDSMLDDITGKEKYASDVSDVSFLDDNIDSILENTETKNCPECNSPVSSSDVFCHSCGAYVG